MRVEDVRLTTDQLLDMKGRARFFRLQKTWSLEESRWKFCVDTIPTSLGGRKISARFNYEADFHDFCIAMFYLCGADPRVFMVADLKFPEGCILEAMVDEQKFNLFVDTHGTP